MKARRALSIFVATLGFLAWLRPALAQTTEEDQAKYAMSYYMMRVSELVQGHREDASDSFPKNPFGEFAKKLYRLTRANYLEQWDYEKRLVSHHYFEILRGEWLSSPKASLRELQAITTICDRAEKRFEEAEADTNQIVADAPEDGSLLKQIKAGARHAVEEVKKQKITGLDLVIGRLILASRLEDRCRFLDEYRDQYETFGPEPIFPLEKPDLQLRYEQLTDAVFEAVRRLARIQNNAPSIETIKKMRGSFGATSG